MMNPKINKIIFLDIDGVFNSVRWFKSWEYQKAKKELSYPLWHLDPKPIRLFIRLLEETKAKVVISSVWRASRDMKYFRDMFRKMDLPFPRGTFIGKMPVILDATKRGLEIQEWLDRNNYKGKYVIVDDDNDMLPGQKLIRVNHKIGFSKKDYRKVMKYLM